MPDKMEIYSKDGKLRYIIVNDETIDVINCPHDFELYHSGERGEIYKERPCKHCGLYKEELKEYGITTSK